MVTVYRSVDARAKTDCERIAEILSAEGLSPAILDDSAPGVPQGAYEVRVPSSEQERADGVVAANPLPDEVQEVDASGELDLETIYEAPGTTTAEVEAVAIQNLLEANGIATVLVGDAVLPNLGFAVRVAREQAERAKLLIAEAQQTGPAAAEAEEMESESTG